MTSDAAPNTPSSKEYHLSGWLDSARQSVSISQGDVHQAVDAKAGLLVALSIEEKFSLLLENYREFEQGLLDATLHRMVYLDFTWSSVQQDIYTINRRLMNVLSSSRFYVDHLAHTLKTSFGSETAATIKQRLSEAHESLFAFRLLEALRNHAQHRGIPIYSLAYPMAREERKDGVYAQHTVSANINVDELRSDPKLTTAIRTELASHPAELSVTPLVREYVQALARVHEHVREAMSGDVGRWEGVWQGLISRAKAELGDKARKLAIFSSVNGSDNVEREMDIWDDFVQRLHFLTLRTKHLPHIARHYVSGCVTTGDD